MADLPIDTAAFLILFARVGSVVMLLPGFSDDGIPMQIRLLMAIGLTMGLYGLLSDHVLAAAGKDSALIAVTIAEALVGLAIGMIIRIMFSAAAMAGTIISLQIGLSSVLVPDASLGGQVPLLSRFVTMTATVACLALGVHHLWIGAIVHSYDVFPVGALPPIGDFARLAVSTLTRATALALSMAAPLIVYGILFNTALGLAARVTPAIQVFFLSQPLNILLGLTIFMTTLGAVLTGFSQAMFLFMQSGWL